MPREIDEDERQEAIEERRAMRRARCVCGDDLPGHCPGPANCPYSGQGEPEEEAEDGDEPCDQE